MAIDVRYGVNPFILGKAAEATGAAGSFLDNRRATLEAQQRAGLQASSIAANQDLQAASQAFQGQQREAERAFDAQKTQYGAEIEEAWRKRALEVASQQQKEQFAAQAAQEERRQRVAWVQRGLEDGTLIHDPQTKQHLNNLQARRAETLRDNSIPPDIKQRILAEQDAEFNVIYSTPSVQLDKPQEFHKAAAGKLAIFNHETGELMPIGARKPKPGDALVGNTREFNITPYKGPDDASQSPQSVDDEITKPKYQTARLGELLTNIKDERKFERDNAIALADTEIADADAIITGSESTMEQIKAAEAAKRAALQSKKDIFKQPLKMPTIMEARQRLEEEMNPQAAPAQQQGQPGSSEQNPIPIASEAEADQFDAGTWVILNGRRAIVRK